MNTNKLDNYLLSNFCKLINLQLDDTNYVTWRFMLESMLVGCDLMGYIDGSIQCPLQYKTTKEGDITSELTQEFKDWRKNDSALITLLASTLSSNALSFIVGSKSSKEVWFSLEERYGKLSKYKAYELKISMQQIQKGNDSIDKYMDRFKTIRDRLSVAGVFVSDEDIIDSVLHGLPFEYATMKTIIRIKTLTSSVSMAELRSLLLIAEYEIEQNVKSILERSKIEMVAHADRFRSGNCISQGTQIGGSSLPKDMYDASGSLYSSSTTHIGHAPPSSAMTGNPHIPPASSISQIGYVSASTRMTARTDFVANEDTMHTVVTKENLSFKTLDQVHSSSAKFARREVILLKVVTTYNLKLRLIPSPFSQVYVPSCHISAVLSICHSFLLVKVITYLVFYLHQGHVCHSSHIFTTTLRSS